MAASSNRTKNWSIYSTHYSPAKPSTISSSSTSSDEQASAATRPSSEVVSYARQRSVFPFGIVSEYDLKETHTSSETNDKILPGNLTSAASASSPCLSSSNPARWGTKILQTSPRSPGVEESFNNLQSTVTRTRARGHFRKRMYSCPATPGSQRRPFERAASVPSIERPKKAISDEKAGFATRENAKELSKSLSEIKIEDGVIIINNGKAIDLRKDKVRKHQAGSTKPKHAEAAKSQSYREFQDAMQKFEDAQLNLEGEVNTKAKTSQTRDKEQQFFSEHVQTQLLDLLTSVKGKRKSKGKKYRC
ncbi:hypothetical protein ACROYT_G034876 [Oculina patagonica]